MPAICDAADNPDFVGVHWFQIYDDLAAAAREANQAVLEGPRHVLGP